MEGLLLVIVTAYFFFRLMAAAVPSLGSTLTIIGYILGYVGVFFLAPWLFWYGVLTCIEWLGQR